MEKIIVNPESVRCLGNIVSPKTDDDFTIVSGTLTYDKNESVNGVTGKYTLTGGE